MTLSASARKFSQWAGLLIAILPICARAQTEPIKLTDKVSTLVPPGWRLVPSPARNIVRLDLTSRSNRKGTAAISVIVSTETRQNHEAALQRMHEIEVEQAGEIRFLAVAGWPAMERSSVIALRRKVADEIVSRLEPPVRTTLVTIAVCVGETIVRYEGTFEPDNRRVKPEDVLKLAEGLRSEGKQDRQQTERDLLTLKNSSKVEKRHMEIHPQAHAAIEPSEPAVPETGEIELFRRVGRPNAPSGLAVPGRGEVQIAASRDGKNVVVATNSGVSFSTNFGATYTVSTNVDFALPRTGGDPSVGVGFSGNFYLATIGFPVTPPPAGGCTDSVARSTDGGVSFRFVGNAVFCPALGPGSCFPDQEQMAVDQFHTPAGLDELYMVWRHFFTPDDTTNCASGFSGNPFPMMSCSDDGGVNWKHQTMVGTGDVGRITVGSDQFVYVTYVSGSNLMINKFSSCSTGLQQQSGFPVTIAGFHGVNCPVPGLDRCSNDATASPQPAVDEINPSHVFVAHADDAGGGNENVILRESLDGGLTWPLNVTMNGPGATRRFMPWVCSSAGSTFVTWYDRTPANAMKPDLTAYFTNRATQSGAALTVGMPTNISGKSDAQCSSGWPCGADSEDDSTTCPGAQLAGRCALGDGTLTRTACDLKAPACAAGTSCVPVGPGCPKYGDYNGNTCVRSGVYLAWASATPPTGVIAGPGINVFTDRTNVGACGASGQSCCFQGPAACSATTLACDSTNTCVTCGGTGQPCCGGSTCSTTDLVCNRGQCQCGGPGQPCCGSGQTCQAGFACGNNGLCACGGDGQPCCGGSSCNDSSLVCDQRTFRCTSSCGNRGQTCCGGTSCLGHLTCDNGVCACGGLNQPCCFSGNQCGSNLVCSNLVCVASGSSCATCTQNEQSCSQRCGPNDTYCQCLCHNSYCGCETANSCGPCSFQSCHP